LLFNGPIEVRTSYSREGDRSLGPERDDRVDPGRPSRWDHGRGDGEDKDHRRRDRQRGAVQRTDAEQHCLEGAARGSRSDETESGTDEHARGAVA